MGARTSNFENFYFAIEINCTSMYICLLSPNRLLCLQSTEDEMEPGHKSIRITNLNRNKRGSIASGEPRPRTLKNSISFNIDLYFSAAQKPALVPANRYMYNAACPYSNTHTKFDMD